MKFFTLALALVTSLSAFSGTTFEQKKEKMEERTEEATSDAGRTVKRASRKVQDETCELVNGKMDCAMKKTKHTIQNGVDNVEDAID